MPCANTHRRSASAKPSERRFGRSRPMRELTVNAKKSKRVRDAIDGARVKLWFMIRTLYIEDEKNPAEAEFCSAIDLITRILSDPDADELVRKYASSTSFQEDGRLFSRLLDDCQVRWN